MERRAKVEFGVHRRTVRQALMSVEPFERKSVMRAGPVREPLIEFIDAILGADRGHRLSCVTPCIAYGADRS